MAAGPDDRGAVEVMIDIDDVARLAESSLLRLCSDVGAM
jgi:hypothetical protein